jgi:hypothetical protein
MFIYGPGYESLPYVSPGIKNQNRRPKPKKTEPNPKKPKIRSSVSTSVLGIKRPKLLRAVRLPGSGDRCDRRDRHFFSTRPFSPVRSPWRPYSVFFSPFSSPTSSLPDLAARGEGTCHSAATPATSPSPVAGSCKRHYHTTPLPARHPHGRPHL